MYKIIKITSVLLSVLFIYGCAPRQNMQVISPLKPLPANCKTQVYSPLNPAPQKYDTLATVDYGDIGFSVNCKESDIKEAMRVNACEVGANGIIIMDQQYPDFYSTCYRAKAILIHVDSRD